jgi:serine/threonine protein kinase/formylglycine-generating enzyme required for sulfatase activity
MSGQDPRIKELFLLLLDVDPAERAAKLQELCGDDEQQREEVESLLRAHSESAEFLERPAFLAEGEGGAIPPLEPGEEVGPYRLREVLGEGGMGVVYLAEQLEPLQRTVALKVLKPGMDSRRVIARFEAERQTLAMMAHPGIARVHDAGTTALGYPYFVMEHVDGEPLVEYCDSRQLDVKARIVLFLDICEAIAHAHRKGVLHRDLKPGNLLITEESGRPAPKVIDFGVAKAIGESVGLGDGLTLAGTVIGTPEYMSPEQADQAESAIDTRSDIYSLGVVLYELLTGALPIDVRGAAKRGFTAVSASILQETPPVASSRLGANDEESRRVAAERGTTVEGLSDALRGDLDWILARTLEKDPELRYASVSEFVTDLRRHLTNRPVFAGPPTGVYLVRKFIARNRGKVIASAAVLLTLIVGLALSLWSLVRTWRAEESLLRLSDRVLLDEYIIEAEMLPFAIPSDALPLRRLEGELEELLGHLPYFENRLTALQQDALTEGAEEEDWTFADPESTWQHGLLTELVNTLTDLQSEEPRDSSLVRVRRRRARAEESVAISTERFAEEWRDAARRIADAENCPAYSGLELPPQIGLVPLGPDEGSGLWEFWHPSTGERPWRGEDGTLGIGEDTGLVFVLIPAGSFEMGARPPRAGEGSGTPNTDRWAMEPEQPVHAVSIGEPFFLSKCEMTQGQWSRITWYNPSHYSNRSDDPELHFDLSHPVENVSHRRAVSVLGRIGLQLPTEAQWEYAARAGSSSAFQCGSAEFCLEEVANVRGSEILRTNLPAMVGRQHLPWDDGWPLHAPVGCFEPNDFGLYDVHGNVFEWVLEPLGSYLAPCDPVDGRRLDPRPNSNALARGGSAIRLATAARVSHRADSPATSATLEVGVRPSRRVVR